MLDLRIWNKKSPLIYPDGKERSVEEVFLDYPFTKSEATVLEYLNDGITVGGIDRVCLLDLYVTLGKITQAECDLILEEVNND